MHRGASPFLHLFVKTISHKNRDGTRTTRPRHISLRRPVSRMLWRCSALPRTTAPTPARPISSPAHSWLFPEEAGWRTVVGGERRKPHARRGEKVPAWVHGGKHEARVGANPGRRSPAGEHHETLGRKDASRRGHGEGEAVVAAAAARARGDEECTVSRLAPNRLGTESTRRPSLARRGRRPTGPAMVGPDLVGPVRVVPSPVGPSAPRWRAEAVPALSDAAAEGRRGAWRDGRPRRRRARGPQGAGASSRAKATRTAGDAAGACASGVSRRWKTARSALLTTAPVKHSRCRLC